MDSTTVSSTHPAVENLVVKTAAPTTDPMLAAMLAGGNRGGGLLGGNGQDGGLLTLLLLSMFRGGNGGLFGGGNGASGGDALAAASLTTPKDVSHQLNTFQTWACNNATELQQSISGVDKSLCQSTSHIISAVNALTPQMFQSFATLTAAVTDGKYTTDKSIDALSAASALSECQTQNLVNTTSAATQFAAAQGMANLAQQLAACCCENRLATERQNNLILSGNAALGNQLNQQTCEIKTTIITDGQLTRALIQANESDRLRTELADAKAQISNANQTAVLIDALGKKT